MPSLLLGNSVYCVQYRESDLDFVGRLLAEDGLSWRVDQDDVDAPDGHTLVLFANSTEVSACSPVPFQPVLAFAGTGSQQQVDSVTTLSVTHALLPARMTLTSFDYKAKSVVAASVPTLLDVGGAHFHSLPMIEHYDAPGMYAFNQAADAERHALLQMQALEARQQCWVGQSTVRSLRAGQSFQMGEHPRMDTAGMPDAWVSTQVVQVGINNLPFAAQTGNAGGMAGLADWLRTQLQLSADDQLAGNAAAELPDPLDAPHYYPT